MERQLHLLSSDVAGDAGRRGAGRRRPARSIQRPISAKNRAIGRRGLVQARAALQTALAGVPQPPPRGARPSSSNTRRRPAA